MRVKVPHVELHPRTNSALLCFAPGMVDYVRLDPDDDTSYWQFWQREWSRGEDLVVVEQDIVVGPETLPQFETCPSVWCAYPYEYSRFGLYAGTGCVRFRGELLRQMPMLWYRVAEMSNQAHPPKHWCSLDAFAQVLLRQAGHQQCVHQPPVEHADSGNSHGCVPHTCSTSPPP